MNIINTKANNPLIGILSFLIVLFTMPLGHAAMILMEKFLGHDYVFYAAAFLGILGVVLLIYGIYNKKQTQATLLGLFGGLFVWTGWIEFGFVYYAHRFAVAPLMQNGEIVTKPEYLIMPSSISFLSVMMLYYLFGIKTACPFFTWFQKVFKINKKCEIPLNKKNTALVTFIELIFILWAFYLVLLFAYDSNFFGDRHFVTYFIAFASLFWSLYLFMNLIKINNFSRAIKYAIPTVIIFWNFVEILGRWNYFHEIWIEPHKYWLETSMILIVLLALIVIGLFNKNLKKLAIQH